jgi:hypothetical protein
MVRAHTRDGSHGVENWPKHRKFTKAFETRENLLAGHLKEFEGKKDIKGVQGGPENGGKAQGCLSPVFHVP